MQPRRALCLGISHRLQSSKVQLGQDSLPGEISVVSKSQFLAVVGLRTLVLYQLLARGHPHPLPHRPLHRPAPTSAGFTQVSL